MALPIKICLAAILCCTIAFARADSGEALQPSEWERSILSETNDPAIENDLFEESSEYETPKETIDNDYAENNPEDSEPNSIEDEDFDGERVKRQLQLPETRHKTYKNLNTQRFKHRPRYSETYRHPSRKVRSIDYLDTDVEETPEADWTKSNIEDFPKANAEDDFSEENPEGDLPEENSQIEPEDENVDSTRVKRQIIFPRPSPTFPYPKGPFSYPKLPRPHFHRTIRSAEIEYQPSEIVCTPPFVRCNPAHKNCRPFGPCRPPPYLPQYPHWPLYLG